VRSARLAAAAVLALLLAGCGSGGPDGPAPSPSPSPSSPTATSAPPPSVDGQAVYDWVKGVVTKPDGSPHFRVPGTPDHAEAARWLAEQMQVPGWTVSWQNFTGQDYAALDKGESEPYYESATYCSEADRARLAGLSFSNLVATLPGAGDRTFVLGAHWDSKAEANRDADPALRSQPVLGANDGASGVGVLLQLLWELSGKELPYTVQVVLFDGEDGFEDCHPLAGSLWFVDQAAAGEVDRMLLLDMVGDPAARFIREGHSEDCDPALVDLLHAKAARHGLQENFPGTRATVQDDHVAFTQAGIPAVDLIDFGRGFPPYWHTTKDTMENLDAAMLGSVASLVLDVMRDPGFSEPWPGPC
jgi:Zn-dependent M28 family amino/carboxypeptidase